MIFLSHRCSRLQRDPVVRGYPRNGNFHKRKWAVDRRKPRVSSLLTPVLFLPPHVPILPSPIPSRANRDSAVADAPAAKQKQNPGNVSASAAPNTTPKPAAPAHPPTHAGPASGPAPAASATLAPPTPTPKKAEAFEVAFEGPSAKTPLKLQRVRNCHTSRAHRHSRSDPTASNMPGLAYYMPCLDA